MNLNNIFITLCRPKYSSNIGSVCRAMKSFDIKNLRVVGERTVYKKEEIQTLAVHAYDVWEGARFFDTIKAATADCALSIGTTRRHGKNRGRLLLPDELAALVGRVTGGGNYPSDDCNSCGCGVAALFENCDKEAENRVAIVFGNEEGGLTDSELGECTQVATIPSSKVCGSLNLSHAVQIICYVLFKECLTYSTSYKSIDLARLDSCVNTITSTMKEVGFFKQTDDSDMKRFWRNVLSRSTLSEGEAQRIESIFTKMGGLYRR